MEGYLYDTHIHTSETSHCGHVPGAVQAERYAAAGYTGIFITDHLHPEWLGWEDRNHNWDEAMDLYLAGYKAAKKRGDELGLNVMLGAEMRFPENNNDYLVYGIDEAWLRSHPYCVCTSAREFFRLYHNEVLVMHAHPYRDGNEVVFEDAVHGVEFINLNPRHENYTEKCLELIKRHPEYYHQAGSDAHQDGDECRGGIISPKLLQDSFAYADLIRSGDYHLYAPSEPEYLGIDEKMRNGSSL